MEVTRAEEPVPRLIRRPRPAGWTGWVAAAAVVHLLVFTAWVAAAPGTPRVRTIVSDLAFLPVGLVGAWVAGLVARRPDLDTGTRRAWSRIGLAFLLWWVGDALWFFWEVVRQEPPFPSWADAGYLAFYPMLLWGLLSLPTRPRTPAERLKLGLDGATVLLGAAMLVWHLVIEPTVRAGQPSPLAVVLALAYPVGDLVVLFGVTLVLLRHPAGGHPAALRWLVAGAALFVVADVAYAHLSLEGAYQGGTWPDVFWMAALVAMLLGAAAQTWAPPREPIDDAPPIPRVTHLPYLAMAAAYALILFVARGGASGPLRDLLLGSAGLTALVLVRQVTALRENARLLARLHQLAATDSLTGLLNRRGFAASAEREVARTARFGGCVTAVMLDIDHFKRINDGFGHSVGDEVIAWVARLCQRHLRAVDVLGRYGGDELVAVLPETRMDQAVVAMERLRASAAATAVPTSAGPVQVSFSIGIADGDGTDGLDELLRRADAALYEAKLAGRGCTRAGPMAVPAV